ncbi:MAG TPA: hypothetical protein VH916_06815, partial [Dehalococcoidia bacterium]
GRSFHEVGFAVVLDDIILGDRWEQARAELAGIAISLVVLAPEIAVVQQRDRDRGKPPIGQWWAEYLDAVLRSTMAGQGLWIDSSALSPEETVAMILCRLWSSGAEATGR